MNMRNTGLLFLALAAAVPACSDDNKNVVPDAAGSTDAGSGGTAAATLTASSDALGTRLLDKDGKTLYFYVKDVASSGASTCDATCQTTWKLADLGTTTTVGTGLTASDFTNITTTGSAQTVWKGRPLYYFTGDTAAGMTAGEGKGGIWFVARAYNLFFAVNSTIANAPEGGADKNATFLTNGAGRTLYVFTPDTRGVGATLPKNTCQADPCLSAWPIWEKPATLTTVVIPSTVVAADVSSFDDNGKQQFTYKGQPTYFFATDTAPGQVVGSTKPMWFTVNAAWNGTF
jgi:predicted lipoprotein with Yx(FWY)xxD motif